jgi:hypothetical protein
MYMLEQTVLVNGWALDKQLLYRKDIYVPDS